MTIACHRFVVIIALFFVSLSGFTKDKPVLNVVGEEWKGVTNADGTGTYFDIISTVFDEDYEVVFHTMAWPRAVELVKRGQADILVGGYEKGLEDLLLSEQHIDTEYPIHLLFDPQHIQPETIDDLSNKLIAGRKGWGLEFHLPPSARFYGVDSIKDISKLIINKRIDGALTYGYNMHFADPNNELLSKEFVPEMPIYLAFEYSDKGKKFRNKFDSRMKHLIEQGVLRSFYNSEADYSHANLVRSDLATVNWHIIPKVLNKKSGKLDVIPWELETSQYIADTITDVQMSIKLTSSVETKKKLSSVGGTCAINLRKPKDVSDDIIYSKPFHTFIKPRLFILENSPFSDELTSMLESGELSLDDALTRNPPLRLAVKNNFGIHQALKTALSTLAFENVLTVENNEFNNLLNLVVQKRIDGIIVWPSIVADLHINRPGAIKLRSYGLKEFKDKGLNTYMACHNDEMGKMVIAQVNDLLSDTKHQQIIYRSQIEKMDIDSAAEYIRSLALKVVEPSGSSDNEE